MTMLDIPSLENIEFTPSCVILILDSSYGIPAAQFEIAEERIYDSE